jgi:alpha-L-fucosidase
MTTKADGTSYFMYMTLKEETVLPAEITINSHQPINKATVRLLGSKKKLKWVTTGEKGFKISIPDKLRENPPSKYVWVFKVSEIK